MNKNIKSILGGLIVMSLFSIIFLPHNEPYLPTQGAEIKNNSFENLERITEDVLVSEGNALYSSVCALSDTLICVAYMNISDSNVYMKVFNTETGEKVMGGFLINNYITDSQSQPDICALTDEIIAVTWMGIGFHDSEISGVAARVINTSSGEFTTLTDIAVNNYTINGQYYPSICTLSTDTFAVSWNGVGPDGTSEVYAKIINATNGVNMTRDILVNSYTDSYQSRPSICRVDDESFAVAWESNNVSGTDYDIFLRIFNSTDGSNLTSQYRVNEIVENNQVQPSICALSNDTLAVAWDCEIGGNYDIHATIINATSGDNLTAEFLVNDFVNGDQRFSSITSLTNKTFAVAWEDANSHDGVLKGIFARILNASEGTVISPEYQINEFYSADQENPAICRLKNDTFAVSWEGDGTAGYDNHVYFSVFGPDIYAPSVSITAPALGSKSSSDSDITITAAITYKGNSFQEASAVINATEAFNMSLALDAGTWTRTWVNTSDYEEGHYNISIWACDEHGNVDHSQHVIIYLGYVPPTTDPGAIPGYEMLLVVGLIGLSIVILVTRFRKKAIHTS